MSPRFLHHLKIVAAVHVLVLVFLLVGGWLKGCFRKKPKLTMPVEFVVRAPADKTMPQKNQATPPSPPDERDPTPSPQRRRKKIERSTKRVTRSPDQAQSQPKLTKKEIEELLAKGAKLSDHTNIPDDYSISLERIRQVLYNAWEAPTKEEAGDAAAEVEIKLGPGGAISSWRISRRSGNASLDESVRHAMGYVDRITGLSSDFLMAHKKVTVSFRVE